MPVISSLFNRGHSVFRSTLVIFRHLLIGLRYPYVAVFIDTLRHFVDSPLSFYRGEIRNLPAFPNVGNAAETVIKGVSTVSKSDQV
jgi:hypothetical protein